MAETGEPERKKRQEGQTTEKIKEKGKGEGAETGAMGEEKEKRR